MQEERFALAALFRSARKLNVKSALFE